jgi:hypothetical protein
VSDRRQRFVAVPGAQVAPDARASGYESAVDAANAAAAFNDGVGANGFVEDFHDQVGGPWPWAVVDTEPPT